ncbi:MAG: ATP-binding protein [Deltaproteobacteria bacterium]|nr:ATP-binding protein [Deltaproteobacteria bacterium]
MASPYRAGGPREDEVEVEGGIVDDLVQQFADPLAFYRELVQNAIDAETEEVVVTVQYAPGQPVVISVTDRGEGMDQEVLQEKLLVLFRSGKEDRDDKIGKFGVGFVSVLAMDPERVTVRTSKGKGTSHVLHLHRDHSYELFEAGGGKRSGTTVSLTIEMDDGAIPDLVKRSQEALARWCRYARTPIHFREVRQGDVVSESRIDRPLRFDDAEVQVTHFEGGTRVVVALQDAQGSYAGFFNQGLLLHETRSPFGGILDGVRFIVQDARLEHTLSRDDVRRDGAFRRALRLVERVAEKQLIPAALMKLAEHAETTTPDHARLMARLMAAMPALPVDPRDFTLRQLVPVEGKRGVRIRDARKRLVLADRSDALTQALIGEGWVVVSGAIRRVLEQAELSFKSSHGHFTHLSAVKTTPADEALLASLADQLEAAARRPSALALVDVVGFGERLPYLPGEPPSGHTLHEGALDSDPFRLVSRPGLLLNTAGGPVREARRLAESDPQVAAALLARDILLAHGRLDASADAGLTEGALAEVLGVTP